MWRIVENVGLLRSRRIRSAQKRLLDQGRGLKRCVFVQIFNNAALEQKTFASSR